MDAQATEISAPSSPDAAFLSGTATQPMLSMPYTVEIDGRRLAGQLISLVEAEVTGLVDPALDGETRIARLNFPFDGFTVMLPVEARITCQEGGAHLMFTDPTGAHLPQLRHVINSFIAGDLVSMGSVFGVVAAGRPKLSGVAPASGGGSRKWVGGFVMLALSAVLVGGVGALAYQRVLTMPIDTPAIIMPEGQTLATIDAGQIEFLNPDAAMGEVAYAVRATSGQVLSVAMPCDCEITLAGPVKGATVMAGEPVMFLSEPDAPLVLTATVPQTLLYDLSTADHIKVEAANGATFDVTYDGAGAKFGASDAPVPVTLTPTSPIPADYAGVLARLTVVKPLPW